MVNMKFYELHQTVILPMTISNPEQLRSFQNHPNFYALGLPS